MKRTSAALKALARQALSGNWGISVGAFLVLMVISGVLMVPTYFFTPDNSISLITTRLLSYMISILITLFTAGYSSLLLCMNRQKDFSLNNLMYAFRHHPDRFIIVSLLLMLPGILVSLPFDILSYMTEGITSFFWLWSSVMATGILSIILNLFFGLSIYLLLDNTQISALDALKESALLMKGNKKRYFYLSLSFLPLTIACFFTCFIGFIWLTPYIESTRLFFYMEIMGELDTYQE